MFDGQAKLAGKGRLKVEKDGTTAVGELAGEAHHPGDRRARPSAARARGRRQAGLDLQEAMVPEAMPKSLLVIGSGAIGIEFASFYRDMGAEVTVVEVLDRILPVEDEEISAFARKAFEKHGMKIRTGAKVEELQKGADSVTATIEADGKTETITVDRVILAVGIVGNVENLGLEGTKVEGRTAPTS